VLRLQAGHAVTPKTMQTPLLLAIVNRGASACTLDGYPRIELRGAAGAPYPFSYRHAGDQEVTSRAPGVVTLRAGAAAWVLINKNACVLNDHGRVARRLDLDPPGGATFLHLTLARQADLDYCPPPDPGHHIEVSPIEPTATRTMAATVAAARGAGMTPFTRTTLVGGS
jgi:hypothetical protein